MFTIIISIFSVVFSLFVYLCIYRLRFFLNKLYVNCWWQAQHTGYTHNMAFELQKFKWEREKIRNSAEFLFTCRRRCSLLCLSFPNVRTEQRKNKMKKMPNGEKIVCVAVLNGWYIQENFFCQKKYFFFVATTFIVFVGVYYPRRSVRFTIPKF